MRALLIDDEIEALSALEIILKDFYGDKITVVAVATNALDGIKKIQKHSPDIVFLDIEMQGGSGFDVAEAFPNRKFKIVFVTAYEEYALRALKMKAHDYILKPVDIDEVGRLIAELSKSAYSSVENGSGEKSRICIPTFNETFFLRPEEIIFIKSSGRYSEVVLDSGKKIHLAKNLGTFERELEKYKFFRIHKSFLANLTHIKGFINTDGWFALMSDGNKIEISRKKIGELKSIIAEISKG